MPILKWHLILVEPAFASVVGSYKYHRSGKNKAAAVATRRKPNPVSSDVESKVVLQAVAADALERPKAIKTSPMKSRRSRRCGQENKEDKRGRLHE